MGAVRITRESATAGRLRSEASKVVTTWKRVLDALELVERENPSATLSKTTLLSTAGILQHLITALRERADEKERAARTTAPPIRTLREPGFVELSEDEARTIKTVNIEPTPDGYRRIVAMFREAGRDDDFLRDLGLGRYL
jgi:hypothetical protein